jgi:hypothetical protein
LGDGSARIGEKIGHHLDYGVTGIRMFGDVALPKPVSERLEVLKSLPFIYRF